MATKLSKYCDGIIEAVWLIAVVVVPVFFNVYSSRIFEPDKITLLRSLTLIILAAWLIKLIEQGGIQWEYIHLGEAKIKSILRIPLILPVFALLVIYIIATIFSITPRVSLLGSYQRLQGTYTTFSYLIIFFALIGNLRRREQIERLITTLIIACLPVSLYGVLQRFRLDPVPWGGDVSSRIAANMGNSIFVAAYLIMVFPLVILRIVESFEALLNDRGSLISNIIRATCYVFIAVLQAIAIYLTGSRGPWLGWASSLIFIWLGLSLIWHKRWLTITGIILALGLGFFLVLLNIPNGPFRDIRNLPEFNRLGQLLDADSRTGRVRTLIWQGASELVLSHSPLEYPDGKKDLINSIRPVIGYGPESMYVSYNPFYPPELTQVEKRNASPDRSHNETWDAWITTGVLGLLVYLVLFGSVLYYGLRWLGLINDKKQKVLFLALFCGTGIITSVGFIFWGGIKFLGVALPFGLLFGLILYLIYTSLFSKYEPPMTVKDKLRAYILLGFLAGIVAHFAEINFGIAIAVTRLYFWVFTGGLFFAGYIFPIIGGLSENQIPVTVSKYDQSKHDQRKKQKSSSTTIRKRHSDARIKSTRSTQVFPKWIREAGIAGILLGVVLVTLGYDLISNLAGLKTASAVLANSLFIARNEIQTSSAGIFIMLFTTWIIGSLLFVSEYFQIDSWSEIGADKNQLVKILLTVLSISLGIALVFWIIHAGSLAGFARTSANTVEQVLNQVKKSENLLTFFYIYLLILLFCAATLLPIQWPIRKSRFEYVGIALAPVLVGLALLIAFFTNLRVIQADIAFKTAETFARSGTWPVAIEIYNHAIKLAPNEDFYYLFLGRAYLEHAKSIANAEEREQFIKKAEKDLLKAQSINPLNTDHTANLARLYSLWSSFSQDSSQRIELAERSSTFFEQAVTLSPNNSRLWDEWGLHTMTILQKPDEARSQFEKALELDPFYDWTYALLADYYDRKADGISEDQSSAKQEALLQAVKNYQKAIELSESTSAELRFNYAIGLAGAFAQLNQLEESISAYNLALQILPNFMDTWRIHAAIAQLYLNLGDRGNALNHIQIAYTSAPDDQKEQLQNFINQINSQP